MKIKINLSQIITVLFFLIYFLSYLGEKSILKFPILIIFQLYLMLKLNKKNEIKYDYKLSMVIICIIIFLIISLMINFNTSGMIKTLSLIDLFIFTYFMYPIIVKNYDSDDELIKIISNTLFIVLFFSFVVNYNDIKITSGRISLVNNVRHLFGFGEPSIAGFLCYIQFTLSFYLIVGRKSSNKSSLTFNLIKVILSLYMIYLTDIRSAMISLIIFVLIYIFEFLPKTKFVFLIKILTALGLTIFTLFYLSNESINNINLDYILSGRLRFYQRGIDSLIENESVWFGQGSYRNSDVESYGKIQLDNSYIDICYQYGIITMILFIILTLIILIRIIKIAKHNNKDNVMHYDVFIKSYFISVVIYSLFEKNLFSLTSALSLVTFCLVFRYIKINYQSQE